MANIFQALVKAGAKVYERTPLWERGKRIATVNSGFTVTPSRGDYLGHSLCIVEDGEAVYVQLKQGVAIDKQSYDVYQFSASRDWSEYGISAGDIKLMAV